jgi:hypothetical protein
MENGFPASDFKQSLETNYAKERFNYWELANQVTKIAPENISIWIFTPNILMGYQGERPDKSESLYWFGFPVASTAQYEISKAFQLSNDSAQILMANAKMNGLGYQKIRLSIQQNKDKNFRFFDSAGQTYLQYQMQQPVLLDRSVLQITIYVEQFKQDAEYLVAAIKSVNNYSGRKIAWKMVNRVNDIPKNQDWLFWLSNQTPIQGTAKKMLYYLQGSNDNERVNWEDDFGRPLLEKDANGNYPLKTHFNPDWNSFVWSNQFPVWIMDLLYPETPSSETVDIRKIDGQQILPIQLSGKKEALGQSKSQAQVTSKNQVSDTIKKESASFKTGTDISWLFWVSICLLVAVERVVTYYQAKNRKHA